MGEDFLEEVGSEPGLKGGGSGSRQKECLRPLVEIEPEGTDERFPRKGRIEFNCGSLRCPVKENGPYFLGLPLMYTSPSSAYNMVGTERQNTI